MHEEGKMLIDRLPAQQGNEQLPAYETKRIDKASLPAPGSVKVPLMLLWGEELESNVNLVFLYSGRLLTLDNLDFKIK